MQRHWKEGDDSNCGDIFEREMGPLVYVLAAIIATVAWSHSNKKFWNKILLQNNEQIFNTRKHAWLLINLEPNAVNLPLLGYCVCVCVFFRSYVLSWFWHESIKTFMVQLFSFLPIKMVGGGVVVVVLKANKQIRLSRQPTTQFYCLDTYISLRIWCWIDQVPLTSYTLFQIASCHFSSVRIDI